MIEIIITAGALVVVEIGLLIGIRKLTKTLQSMDEKIKRFDKKVENIESGILTMGKHLKDFTSGDLKVVGNTPIGRIDVELSLTKNKQVKQ